MPKSKKPVIHWVEQPVPVKHRRKSNKSAAKVKAGKKNATKGSYIHFYSQVWLKSPQAKAMRAKGAKITDLAKAAGRAWHACGGRY